jgi:hypothetical protein
VTVYYVDDGGSSTSPYDTWAKAATSINTLDAAIAFASGDIVYFGHDHNCQAVNTASLTITGPTSGLPVVFISATTGSDPPAYQKGTGNQIDTTEGAFDVNFVNSIAMYGLRVKSGQHIAPLIVATSAQSFYAEDCTWALGADAYIQIDLAQATEKQFKKLTVDLTQDGSTNRGTRVFSCNGSSSFVCDGLSFINAGFRTGVIFGCGPSASLQIVITGADFSGFTNAIPCEYFDTPGPTTLTNCKTASTFALHGGGAVSCTRIIATNVGPTDDPTSLKYHTYFGDIVSSTLIYRSSGATIEGIANSWLVTTTANCNEYAPFHGPWMPSRVATAGTKNFDVFISNDSADFTDAEVWLEVEYLATAGSPLWTLASDQRATITTTAVVQDDDVTSTWNGAGPAFTFKQRLRVTATVNEPGQFRARVVVGVASIASSRNFYVDPDVTVT